MQLDTTNICSHLKKKLFDEEGVYHSLWKALHDDKELTAVVRSRQLHIYRNGKKVLVLAGKSSPKIIKEDEIIKFVLDIAVQIERIKQMEQCYNRALVAIENANTLEELESLKDDVAVLDDYYNSELWKKDFTDDEAGRLPKDLKRGVLSEDGIWNLLSEYRELQNKEYDKLIH